MQTCQRNASRTHSQRPFLWFEVENIHKRWPELAYNLLFTSGISSSLFVKKAWAVDCVLELFRGWGCFSFRSTSAPGIFCILPSLPRRDIQDGGHCTTKMFFVQVSVNKLEDVLLMISPIISVFTAFSTPRNYSMSVQEILLSSGKRCADVCLQAYKAYALCCSSLL